MNDFIFMSGDTDGLKFCKRDMTPFTEDEINGIVNEINKQLEGVLNIESDGYFDDIVVIKKKNYILRNKKETKFKGGSLTDSKKEPILLKMIQEIGTSLLSGINYPELEKIYKSYIQKALNVTEIKPWAVKRSISKSILACETNPKARTNEKKVWDVIKGKNFKQGDKIWTYNSIDGMIQKKENGELKFNKKTKEPVMVENKILKLVEDYNNDHDEHKMLKRVFATLKIFKTVIDIDKFVDYSKKSNLHLLHVDLQE